MLADERGEHTRNDVRGGRNAQQASFPAFQCTCLFLEEVCIAKEPAALVQKVLTVGGELEPPANAIEQYYTQLVFKPSQLT